MRPNRLSLPRKPVHELGEIPYTVHLIWVGSEMPPWARASWQRWAATLRETRPGWTLETWTDERVQDDPMLSRVAAIADHYGQPPRGKANLLRLAIVSRYGGVYTDTDSVLALPEAWGLWAGPRSSWIAADRVAEHKTVLNNACFGMPPLHPLLAEVFELAQSNLARGVRHTHAVSGPKAWRKVWESGYSDRDPASGGVPVTWVWPTDNNPKLSRAFYACDPLPQPELIERARGFPVVQVGALTAADRGYAAVGGGQQLPGDGALG